MKTFRHAAKLILTSILTSILTACSGVPVEHFDHATPGFDPIAYFDGPTHSWGVIQTADGAPKSRFRAELSGHRDADGLALTQNFTFEDGHTQQRNWHLHRVDAHRYDAIANDVIGVATGYAYGNAFRWDYTLQLTSNPLSRVQMHHWMYLAGDGVTLLNQVTIRKFGVQVGGTTEYFQRGVEVVVPGISGSQ